MGQEQSFPVDESVPPKTLRQRSIASIAKYISGGHAQNIVLMVGAGISTSAGIPDFRSPETGLYANLARLDLPFAEAVFDISYFKSNPMPFYALAHELYPGKFQPTISHCFIRMLSDKGILLKVFTQNIDCLERSVGIPDDKIVEAHGSFARQSCIDCHSSFPQDLMKQAIKGREVPHCQTPQCNGLVKPEIVFFGEQLPANFHQNRRLPMEADLCIIMGTSLTVQPFASLPEVVQDEVPRLLINTERVGGLGSRADDVLQLGDCDTEVRKLASALGWEDDLTTIWNATRADTQESHADQTLPQKSRDDMLNDQVANLTDELDKSLKISTNHHMLLQDQLEKEGRRLENSETELLQKNNFEKRQKVDYPAREKPANDTKNILLLTHGEPKGEIAEARDSNRGPG